MNELKWERIITDRINTYGPKQTITTKYNIFIVNRTDKSHYSHFSLFFLIKKFYLLVIPQN